MPWQSPEPTVASVGRREFLKRAAAAALPVVLPTQAAAIATSPHRIVQPQLTVLNSMAAPDFELAVARCAGLGLRWIDLKNAIWDQSIDQISVPNAQRAAALLQRHQIGVFCLSTSLCASNIAAGERVFRSQHSPVLEHVLTVAEILKPKCIRLLSASIQPFPQSQPLVEHIERSQPWIFAAYREMVDCIYTSGYACLIENEVKDVILNDVNNITSFFQRLQRPGRAHFTWDVQNLWETGVFPTLDVYRQLKPLIGCVHLKGGRHGERDKTLATASALADASWPVVAIVGTIVKDAAIPTICLNPSHGQRAPGYDDWSILQRDVGFLRQSINANL